MRVAAVLTYVVALSVMSPSGAILSVVDNRTTASSSFLNNFIEFNCHTHLKRVVSGIKFITNSSAITVAFDTYEDSTDHLINLLYSSIGSFQTSRNNNLSSTLTVVFIESEINTSKDKRKIEFWDPAYFYLIIIKHKLMSEEKLLYKLWHTYRVCDAFIVSCLTDYVASFNPFSGQIERFKVRDIVNRKVLENRFNDWKRSKIYFIYPGELEQSKIKKEKIKPSTYDDPIIRVISDFLNADMVILGTGGKQTYGEEINGTFQGTFEWLVNGSAHMTCATHFMNQIYKEIPFTNYITMEKLCFTVPALGQVPYFKAILKLLNVFVMTSILLMFFITGLIYRFLRFLASKTPLKTELSSINIGLTIVSLLLGMSFHSTIKMTFERIIIGSLLLMNFVITVAFQSTLTTVLSKPVYYKKVESKEELEQSGVEIWSTRKTIVDSLKENGYSGVNFKLKPAGTDSNGFSVGWMSKVNVMLETKSFKYRNNDNYFTNECPNIYSMGYFYYSGMPSKNRINHIISVLVETGHIARWVKESYQEKGSGLTYEKVEIKESVTNKPLTAIDLQFVFVLLGYGLALSSLIFLIELIWRFCMIKKFKSILKNKTTLKIKFQN